MRGVVFPSTEQPMQVGLPLVAFWEVAGKDTNVIAEKASAAATE